MSHYPNTLTPCKVTTANLRKKLKQEFKMNEQAKQPDTGTQKSAKEVTVHECHSEMWRDLIGQSDTMLTNIKNGDDDYIAEEQHMEDMTHFAATCKAHGWSCSVDDDADFQMSVERSTMEECVVTSLQFALRNCCPPRYKQRRSQ